MEKLGALKGCETNERFANIDVAPVDPIFSVKNRWQEDSDPKKVNMGIGAYRNNEGKPQIFKAVKEAELKILNDPNMDKEYLPISGLEKFNQLSRELIFGSLNSDKITTVQAISGTGALRVGAEFLAEQGPSVIYVSLPSWPIHVGVFTRAGLKVKFYKYWNYETKDVNFDGMLQTIDQASPGSIVLLHTCAHNPTGCDLKLEQWELLADLIQAKKLFPLFDIAYQGFASGDVDKDVQPIRMFAQRGMNFLVAQSFAKNIGLYGERIGALHAVCSSSEIAQKVNGQLKQVIRPLYSNPPRHGAWIVATILEDSVLKEHWLEELKECSQRIISMRQALKQELDNLGTPGDWSHITKQIGMFSYTGLSEQQVIVMENNHCYLMRTGRMNVAGLNTGNVRHVAESIHKAVTTA